MVLRTTAAKTASQRCVRVTRAAGTNGPVVTDRYCTGAAVSADSAGRGSARSVSFLSRGTRPRRRQPAFAFRSWRIRKIGRGGEIFETSWWWVWYATGTINDGKGQRLSGVIDGLADAVGVRVRCCAGVPMDVSRGRPRVVGPRGGTLAANDLAACLVHSIVVATAVNSRGDPGVGGSWSSFRHRRRGWCHRSRRNESRGKAGVMWPQSPTPNTDSESVQRRTRKWNSGCAWGFAARLNSC
jgi:hypothetical protein